MKLFLSYAQRDREVVDGLRDVLEGLGHNVWFDDELVGGQDWWDRILTEIRQRDAVLFALSGYSNASRPCQLEVVYAGKVGRPVLAVQVGPGDIDRAPPPVPRTQIVDWRRGPDDRIVRLVRALAELPEPRAAHPPRLPEEPAAPLVELGRVQAMVRAERLDHNQQWMLYGQFKKLADDEDAAEHLGPLLREFRGRGDLITAVTGELDLLAARVRPRRPASHDQLTALWSEMNAGNCIPMLGFGLTERLIGPPSVLARQLTERFEFALAGHERDELARVAQFVSVMVNRRALLHALEATMQGRLGTASPEGVDADTGALLRMAWEDRHSVDGTDPYSMLADLPSRIYVTTHPLDLLVTALRRAGRSPEIEVCRWRDDESEWPTSIFEKERGFEPSAERPLVVYLFGQLGRPNSLVLTEDDHLEFLTSLTRDPDIVHERIRAAIVESAVLLLGYDLERLDTKVVLRSLVAQEGSGLREAVRHLAVQVDPAGSVLLPDRAREYLSRYFGRRREGSIEIYWGSAADFVEDMMAARQW